MKKKIIIWVFSLLCVGILDAAILNVPVDYATIQAGMNAANTHDTVLVDTGTYVENINFNGKNITVASLFLTTQDTSYISQTVIDGDSLDSVVKFENGEDSTAVLCGFTITNGYAQGSYDDGSGGGIFCFNYSNPSIKYLTITDNIADYFGGGIYCLVHSSPNVENVLIIDNTSIYGGGGIYCGSSSSPSLKNVIIMDNTSSCGGGGICFSGSNSSLENVTISGNIGWGIHCGYGSPSLKNVTITGNSNGGINLDSYGSPSLVNSIVSDNSGYGIAAGYEYSYPTITYSDFYNNENGNFDYCSPGTGCIEANPLFADSANNDYHLTENSPCIDAGNPNSPLDPDGTIADMGAYYYDLSGFNHPVHNITQGNDYLTIQTGIHFANIGDTLIVDTGTYFANVNFFGKNITVASKYLTTQDTSYILQTIIDGSQADHVITFENEEDSLAVLTGFTITNGYAQGIFSDSDGGGIYCKYSSPTLENVTIIGNSASDDGGGICCGYNSSPSLKNVRITSNSASDNGGGIYCFYNSSMSLENVTITYNSASNNGGGIYCHYNSSPSLINSIVSDNIGQYGIIVYSSNPKIIYSDFYNNEGGNFYGVNDSIGVNVTTNANGDSCDAFYNIQLDPLFVDPANNDYHLSWVNYPIPDSTMSPCIDAGDPNSPLDPDGTIADMGAYYFNQNVSVDEQEENSQNTIWSYPNPTQNSTTILYSLKKNSHVMISIYNIKGQLVTTLVDATKPKGEYSVEFETKALSSGVYFYKIQTEDRSEIKKMIVIR